MEQSKNPTYTVETEYSNGLQTHNEVQSVNHIDAVNIALTFDRKIHGKQVQKCKGALHNVSFEGKLIEPVVETIFEN